MAAARLFKRFFKMAVFRACVCALAAQYIRFVYYTSRRHMDMHEEAKLYLAGEEPAVFAFWHARLLMMPMICPKKRKTHVLISLHGDGELIARTMHHFGFGTPRGSTSKGGARAAKDSIRRLKAGENVSVTPDGPRGPAMQVQPGILTIARLAGVPIIPATYASTRHKRMKSWDRFMVALPFGTLYFKVGAPMMNVTKEALENQMVTLTREVDIQSAS